MNASQGMDASVLMQKLVEREINTNLLIEFYDEVAENERIFNEMVKDISTKTETEERLKTIKHIERFCVLLRELQEHYEEFLSTEIFFSTETAKRESMVHNASRFLELLEKECNLQFPDLT
ncbi:hypothetical protein [Chryseosolibacter indicus]|uniref:Uncharacterized protein n=1 Tax=Chryseosolibacter indicus TaxID=2782351 RepID=A0ABS5VM92_9BACT|nr:hypothetical protein [Chryseosolibacter indicus]MBT1701887.1 hypothetical protein [Chryseosolibacter indicus]